MQTPESAETPPAVAPEPVPAPAPAGEVAGPVAPTTDAGLTGLPPGAAETGGGPRRRRRRRRKGRRGEAGESGAPGSAVAGAPAPGGAAPAGPRPERRYRDERREPRQRDARQGSEHHAITAVRALAAMVEGLLRVEGVDPLDMPRSVEIPVRIPLDVRRDGVRAASDAMQQILKRIQEVRSHERALVPGAVYCYFQDTAQAQHCRPEQPREVFDGYASTGRPVFTDFVTMAIERKDPLLDRLLAGDDVILTHVTMGRVLRTQQLQEFGKTSPVYRILGQVDAGLFPLLNDERKAAFSFQLLRGTTLEGKPRLRLHTVGAVDLLDVADPEVANLVYRFQRHLDAESLRLAGLHKAGTEDLDEEEFVLPLLKDLAQALSGYSRRAGRRTQHAVERSEQGVRPTAKAYEDAEQAGDSDLLQDDVEGTVVVVGPKGRVHVFTTDAKHVTSLNMQGSAVAKRRQQGRWRPAEPEERGEFRLRLKRRRSAGEDTVAEATPDASVE